MRNKKLIALLSVVAAIVVLTIVSCAVFLVRDIEAYTEYVVSEELENRYKDKIIKASGIEYLDHMFFINEDEVKRNIENAFYDVEVKNIERRFPDGVSINFVIHDNLFQVQKDNKFYQCYSSGRIGSVTTESVGGYFTVKLSSDISTQPGKVFQGSGAYEYKIVMSFINYLRSTGLNAKQIAERVDFIDLTKKDLKKIMIHTRAGCYIELRNIGDDFTAMLDYGWSAFDSAPTKSENDESIMTNPSQGVFIVSHDRSSNNRDFTYSYGATINGNTGDVYYAKNYE